MAPAECLGEPSLCLPAALARPAFLTPRHSLDLVWKMVLGLPWKRTES